MNRRQDLSGAMGRKYVEPDERSSRAWALYEEAEAGFLTTIRDEAPATAVTAAARRVAGAAAEADSA
jgi:hypothetical protein